MSSQLDVCIESIAFGAVQIFSMPSDRFVIFSQNVFLLRSEKGLLL